MADMPEISVIIPTRGRPELLRRAIESVGRQDFASLELVVVDDGAGEGVAIARGYDFCPTAILSSAQAGQVAARNLGVAAASGRVIAWLDDDDWWEDAAHLADLTAALTGDGIAYTSGRIVRERPGEADEVLPFQAQADAASLRHDNKLLVPGIAYPRALHAWLGPFDPDLPIYWDWDWYLRVAAAGLGFYRSRGDGVRVSSGGPSASSPAQEALRRADLARLCAKHGLTGVVLKNHEGIAREQAERP